jgi:hypothetical protein
VRHPVARTRVSIYDQPAPESRPVITALLFAAP